ncbi:MAG: glycosyltransferase, partial [Desulfovibrio sp.]|nr:glycosyltransferase [Desulfovibrio sp.]
MVPKVSVIIPVYNTELYLRRCLDSVCGQTLRDIEIICVNDGSPDNCGEILREYAAKDARMRVIDFPENRGASAARNAGMDAAQGEYIGFVDSDDYMDLNFYEELYAKGKETCAKVVKGAIKEKDEETGALLDTGFFYKLNERIRKNKTYFYHSFTTAIYSSFTIKNNHIRFHENLIFFEDPVFTIQIIAICDSVSVL